MGAQGIIILPQSAINGENLPSDRIGEIATQVPVFARKVISPLAIVSAGE